MMIKIRFVKNLDVMGAEAVCIWWCDEIHVDEKLRDSPRLQEILKHEMRHYRIFQRVIREGSWYDCTRIQISRILRRLKVGKRGKAA